MLPEQGNCALCAVYPQQSRPYTGPLQLPCLQVAKMLEPYGERDKSIAFSA